MNDYVPTRELFPQYLKTQRWLELADAIDKVFQDNIEPNIKGLEHIRHQYILNDEIQEKINNHQMIKFGDYDMLDRTTAAMQTNILGLSIADSSYVGRDGFVNITRNLGTFWFSKGLFDFIDFIGYALNAKLTMINMWTKDYVHFVPEDLVNGIGRPVYQEGGTWYPTTHVRLRFDPATLNINTLPLLARLFYDLANYNLVLQAVEEASYIYIAEQGAVPDSKGVVTAAIVALGRIEHEIIEIGM